MLERFLFRGGLAERLKAAVLKTVVLQKGTGGSNPSSSATTPYSSLFDRFYFLLTLVDLSRLFVAECLRLLLSKPSGFAYLGKSEFVGFEPEVRLLILWASPTGSSSTNPSRD